MATEGVDGIYLETHDWCNTAKFLQGLGFEAEFSHEDSGLFRNGGRPYIFVQQVRPQQNLTTALVLRAADAAACCPPPAVEVLQEFQQTYWGEWEMKVLDPDGRMWSIQAPENTRTRSSVSLTADSDSPQD
jgi:uncharacterized glyoxalase superfamily protein PhnB